MPKDSVVHTVTLEEPTEFELQYRGHQAESRIRQHFQDSTTIDWNEFEPPVDMIFIDGAHEFPFVDSDTRNALEIIKRPGGIIFWHDYASRLDVAKVVDAIDPSIEVNALIGTQLAVARF
jgi:hypothetical protein